MATKKGLQLFILILIGALHVKAQEQKASPYAFPKFIEGNIRFKVGADVKAKLNYNTVTEEMLYLTADNEAMTLAETAKIDTVSLNERKFIPLGTRFYEAIPAGKTTLFVRLVSKAIPQAANVGMGTSQTTAQSVNFKMRTNIGIYALELPDYNILPKNEYYLKKGQQYLHIINANNVASFYPEKSKEIKQFAKDNKIDFSNISDIVKLLSAIN